MNNDRIILIVIGIVALILIGYFGRHFWVEVFGCIGTALIIIISIVVSIFVFYLIFRAIRASSGLSVVLSILSTIGLAILVSVKVGKSESGSSSSECWETSMYGGCY